MRHFIELVVVLPLLGFLLGLLLPPKKEKWIASLTFGLLVLHFFSIVALIGLWWKNGRFPTNFKELTVFKSFNYEFYVDFYFDKISLTYLFVGSFITLLIARFSKYYMHREDGYKRFFNTLMFFYLGYTVVASSGNLETLFIGWEILGICSFLLIAFYRHRFLPVKNSLKVFFIYRIGDVGILLAMWLSHHLWHENISFIKLNNFELVHEHLDHHTWMGVWISVLLLISASAKSALFPFSSWLPRAMEGPTPSSAVFYGSLSVHMGAFLMLRTYPFWEQQTTARIAIILLGLVTALIGTWTSRVQSNIKSQIAYASIAQIGLIFIEIAFGLEEIALVHIAGNAFLRTYQLLISPSTVTYKIREQFFQFEPKDRSIEDTWPKRIEYGIYMLSLKEWKMDDLHYRYLWNPIKRLGNRFNFVKHPFFIAFAILLYAAGWCLHLVESEVDPVLMENLPSLFAIIGLIFVLKSFTERRNVYLSWWLVVFNHFWIALAISYNEHFEFSHHVWYLSGVIVGGLLGYFALRRLQGNVRKVALDRFYGYSFEYPKLGVVFFIACLILAGFPISPTFIGEDLVFSHIHENQVFLALAVSLSLIVDGLSLVRIYSRIFQGPFIKTFHGIVKRNL